MSTACLFIGWKRPVAGKESEAFGVVMREAIDQVAAFQKQGWFESHDVIALTPHFGETNMFFLLQGERAKLDELRRTDEFERFSMRLGRVMDGYGVVPGVTFEGMKKVFERNPDLAK